MAFKIVENDGVKILKIEELEKLNIVKHGFSTRIGGVSKGSYDSMNLGFGTEDNRENVRENLKRLCKAIEVNDEDLVFADQVHDNKVKIVTEEDKGKGILYKKDYRGMDGLITNRRNVPLLTFHADCVPLFFVDPVKKVIAAVHAGWRGTALKIGEETVTKMLQHFNCKVEDIIVAIGPSIGTCCYEVAQDVIDQFNTNFTNTSRFVVSMGQDKYMLDLWEANRLILKEIGILDRNIIKSELCTCCNEDLFYSHRRDKGLTGRMVSIIELV
ncbi:MAG: peptidoglycan editing factor PgeF [Clostridiaceae bacterium]|nr:peptidoglycan editing factor PgeF [Clostridiaceae bacterium]